MFLTQIYQIKKKKKRKSKIFLVSVKGGERKEKFVPEKKNMMRKRRTQTERRKISMRLTLGMNCEFIFYGPSTDFPFYPPLSLFHLPDSHPFTTIFPRSFYPFVLLFFFFWSEAQLKITLIKHFQGGSKKKSNETGRTLPLNIY